MRRTRSRKEGRIDARSYNARDHLEAELGKRASHRTAGHILTACPFVRAKRFLRRGCRGRLPIQILQNVADVSRGAPKSAPPHEEKE